MAEGVQYSERLVQSLERSLQSALNLQYLRLTRQPRKPGSAFYVELDEGLAVAQLDDGSEQSIAQILTADSSSSPFYLGFVAVFELAATRKYCIRHASLSVFHEIAEDITPLFRAEWDELDASSETSNHAQPHWHFVQTPERIERIVRTRLPPVTAMMEFTPERESELFFGSADCGKFHFAMTSLWERTDTPSPKRLFDTEDFPKWFAGLTQYIAGQIKYLIEKMPGVHGLSFTP